MTALDFAPTTRRITGLARTNALLQVRNRLTLAYAVLTPLLPLGLLFLGDRGDIDGSSSALAASLLMALLFPIYYNLLSMFVTRRDELVLKRLRTGEVRDVELVLSMALPGVVVVLVVTVLTVVTALAIGLPFPLNPVLLLITVLLASAAFTALALWTASWTRTAEAAQMTSAPVLVIASLGLFGPIFPEAAQRWLSLLPGAAVNDLLRLSWFGRTPELGSATRYDFWQTWVESASPLLVLVGWTVAAVWLAWRGMQWEPRS